MLRLMFGVLIGGLAAWLYRSEQTREQVRQGLAGAPVPLRQGAESLASAGVSGAERAAGLLGAAPLPPQVKDRATAAVRSAAEWARRGGVGSAKETQSTEQPALVPNPIPEDILAEQDAAARAAAEARAELQAGL